MPSPVLQHFTIDQSIPANLRSASTEGVLPLHITFNIPLTLLGADMWNSMLRELNRHEEDANITDTFADHFAIYLQAETNGRANVWNLTQQLADNGVYSQQVKVFIDEERGRSTIDTDRGVLTISFIVMLMDGTRDGVRPELSIVPDGEDTSYIVVRDGNFDNKWKLTFFIASASYSDNTDTSDKIVPVDNNGGGGGGGCNAYVFGVIIVGAFFLFCGRKKGC